MLAAGEDLRCQGEFLGMDLLVMELGNQTLDGMEGRVSKVLKGVYGWFSETEARIFGKSAAMEEIWVGLVTGCL